MDWVFKQRYMMKKGRRPYIN